MLVILFINGIIPTMSYYLRLISKKRDFLSQFLEATINDSELQNIHKNKINKFFEIYVKNKCNTN